MRGLLRCAGRGSGPYECGMGVRGRRRREGASYIRADWRCRWRGRLTYFFVHVYFLFWRARSTPSHRIRDPITFLFWTCLTHSPPCRAPSSSVSSPWRRKRCVCCVCGALLTLLQGVGARVRRSIGSRDLPNLTPFLMLDHFHVSQGAVSTFHSPPRHPQLGSLGLP